MSDFENIVKHHIITYPSMKITDLYKLAFQAAMGPGHAVPDRSSAEKWIKKEIVSMDIYSDRDIIDPICKTNGLVRVNLRPFVKSEGDISSLLDAFIATANDFRPEISNLKNYWKTITNMAKTEKIFFDTGDLDDFFRSVELKSFPAVHHSDIYRDSYKPAYRVVYRKFFDSICTKKQLTST